VSPVEELRLMLILYSIIALVVTALVVIFVIAPLRGWWPFRSARPADRADESPGAEQEGDGADS
jgi:hypothetical protein